MHNINWKQDLKGRYPDRIKMLECGPGWKLLIEEALSVSPSISFTQIKEKFGTLRLYSDTATDEEMGKLEKIEKKSAHICELCGGKGVLCRLNGYWWATLCSECKEKE